MKRITDKLLRTIEESIRGFFPDFTLGARYNYYAPEYHYPPGRSGVMNFDSGLSAREVYHWMNGFRTCYRMLQAGNIATPRIAPAGKSLWVVEHVDEDGEGCVNFVYVPEDMSWEEVIEQLRPKGWKPNDNDLAIEIEFDRIWRFNRPVDTQGEKDGI